MCTLGYPPLQIGHTILFDGGVFETGTPHPPNDFVYNIQIVLRIESPKFHENIKTFGIASPMCGKGRIWVLHKSEPQFPAVGLPPSLSKGFPWGPRQASVESVDLIGKMKF